ncbi:MAG: hypothetical protein P4L33_15450 [Capsulimonadaceae bacterium]|nr:hypothetical protein [Capsulimonadaceae bacterium]
MSSCQRITAPLWRTTLFTALLLAFAPSCVNAQLFDARDPASSGYTLTFTDDFKTIDSIDVNATGNAGYKWYTKQFFGGKPTSAAALSVHKGVLTIDPPDNGNSNGSIETACPAKNAQGWIGSVFSGGAYFEASIAFDPALIDTKAGWPSFWSMAVEHMATKGADQWEGQDPGYAHFIEDDFFEFDTANWAGKNSYGGAVHDWFGKWTREKGYSGNVQNKNFVIHVPDGTDFNKFHKYGNLWVPASPANDWRGFIQYYFDGLPTSDIVTWDGKTLPGTPPPSEGSLFAIADKANLVVILGCGAKQAMRVKYVHVWQHPADSAAKPS